MNNTMSTTSQFKDLKDFLVKHSAKGASPGTPFTHTRIADPNSNIYGGAYIIPNEELALFHSLYYEHIFVNKSKEYLQNLFEFIGDESVRVMISEIDRLTGGSDSR